MSSTGPSQYQGTTNNPKYGSFQTKFYYYDSFGNTLYDATPQNFLNYVSGNSYVTYAFRFPDYRWATTSPTIDSVTFSADIDNLSFLLKNIPSGKRGAQPFAFNAFNDRIYYFNEDKVSTLGEPNTNFYLRNWGITSATNNYPSLWAAAGISTQFDYWKSWFEALSSQGATVDSIFMDNEGSVFEGGFLTNSRRDAIINDPRFVNTFQGFTSMADIYQLIGQTGATYFWNYNVWLAVSQFYKAINFTKAYGDSLLSVYPNAVLSDYGAHHGMYYKWIQGEYPNDLSSSTPTDLNYAELFGAPRTQIRQIGNASSPILYGWFRELAYDWGNLFFIRGDDPTIVYFPYNQNPYSYKDSFISTGPWASFIQAMSVLRDAKRGNPNIPLTPWIGSVYMTGDGYVLKNSGFDTSSYYGRAPSVVLNKLWRKQGVTSVTKGFTAPDGSTSGFRIIFNPPSTISSIWYKRNATINNESGITNSYSIQSFGITGSTSALAYYVSGLTVGQTYIFGYDIDLDRGYTNNMARFTVWSTNDTASFAPLLPNTSTIFNNVVGITFNQILPVTGGNVYRQSGISYELGNSSWTGVAWSFVPQSSSTNIGLHVYFTEGLTYSMSGYTTWIRNPYLFNQTLGTTFAINSINNLTYSSTRTALSYYSNEITAGQTYAFSYYLNLDQNPNITYPFVRQRAFDVYPSTYQTQLLGATIQQYEPIISGLSNGIVPIGISSGSSGWTKFVYKFVKGKLHQDVDENPTIELSLYDRLNHYSVVEPTASSSGLDGFTAFVWEPKLELEGVCSTINLNVTPLDSEYSMDYMQWRDGPPGGFCDIKKGYDSRTNIFCVERGGNSAYYYELLRHASLHGTKAFGFFNPMSFEDMGMTGAKSRGRYNQLNINQYLTSGRTGYLQEFEILNQCMQDVHNKIGGFTLATATSERVNWTAPYFLSGAPDTKGTTWWWRITVKPGHTMYINGLTLSSENPGAWIGTTGPTFAGVNFTITSMDVPSEPIIATPIKDLNYLTMSSINDLLASGTIFSRGSTASYIGPSGYLMYAAPNQPRFEYYPNTLQPRGLLLERAATNLLNWSESFANTGGIDNNWSDFGLTRISGVTSPQNITNAIRFVATSENATLISTNPVLNGTTGYRSFSFWARGITGNEQLYYTIDGGTSWVKVLNISSSWNRIEYGPWFTGSTIEYPYIKLLNNTVYHSHHVGFKLGGTGQSIEIWGAQVEDRTPIWGSVANATPQTRKRATSYIPTQGASAGRAVDSSSIPGASGDLWIGSTQGTFIYEVEGSNWMTGRITISGSSASNWCDWSDDTGYQTWSIPGGSISGLPFLGRNTFPTPRCPIDIPIKWAFTYNNIGTKVSATGKLSFSTFSGFSGFGTNKSIGFVGPITGLDSIYIRRIRHWNYVLNDTDLQNMTRGNIDLIKWMNRGDGGNLLDFNPRI